MSALDWALAFGIVALAGMLWVLVKENNFLREQLLQVDELLDKALRDE
jgi:hypothetical protein